MANRKQIRIAAMAINNVEDIEFFVPIDLWKRAGFMVDVVVCEQRNGFVLGYSGLKVAGNFNLNRVNFSMYDAIFIPGGPGCMNFLVPPANGKNIGESRLNDAIRKFVNNKSKWLIGICASPVIFFRVMNDPKTIAEGKLDPKFNKTKFTAFNDPNILKEYQSNWQNKNVVVDNQIITAQAAGNALELAFTTIEKLGSTTLADEVARRINFDWPKAKRQLKLNF